MAEAARKRNVRTTSNRMRERRLLQKIFGIRLLSLVVLL
jgi:hypothetical protein